MVTPPVSARFRYAILLVSALWLAGCMGEEPPEYDVPAGQTLRSAQVITDSDGSVFVMAQVAMFYSMRGTPGPWDPKTVMRNVQTLVFAESGGAWAAHPFRNVQAHYGGVSFMAADADGNARAFVQDRTSFGTYAREGGEWISKGGRFPGAFPYQSYYVHSLLIGPAGESGWESFGETYSLSGGQQFRRQEIVKSDGGRFELDTNQKFQPRAYLSGRDKGFLLGIDARDFRSPSDTGSPPMDDPLPDLVCYVWSRDSAGSRPRKHLVIRDGQSVSAFFARVEGETRLYANANDASVMEFAWRGNEFVYLRDLAYPSDPGGNGNAGEGGSDKDGLPDMGTGRGGFTTIYSMHAVDSKGCSHALARIMDASYRTSGFLHKSTCREGVDTIALPAPTKRAELSRQAEINFVPGPDGTVLIAFVMNEPRILDFGNYDYGDSYLPSWLYLARSKPSGGWDIGLIATY